MIVHLENGDLRVPGDMVQTMLDEEGAAFVPRTDEEREKYAEGLVPFEGKWIPIEKRRKAIERKIEAAREVQVCRTPRLCRVMIEMTEIRQLSDSDLQERIDVEREALAKLRFNHTVAGLESTTALKYKKRDVARLLTELNARKNANS